MLVGEADDTLRDLPCSADFFINVPKLSTVKMHLAELLHFLRTDFHPGSPPPISTIALRDGTGRPCSAQLASMPREATGSAFRGPRGRARVARAESNRIGLFDCTMPEVGLRSPYRNDLEPS
jgi:hypothetical protein